MKSPLSAVLISAANPSTGARSAVFFSAIFMALGSLTALAEISVARTSSFPGSPDLTIVKTPLKEGQVELRNSRLLTQTFQVTTGFTIDKFHIAIGNEGFTAGATFSVSIFTVADTTLGAPSAVPSAGTNLLTTTSATMATSGSGNVLEFDLTGADEIFLAANTGSAGYALQFNRSDSSSAFRWALNESGDGTSGGTVGPDQYTSGQAYGTPLGGGFTHGNSDFTLAFTAVSAAPEVIHITATSFDDTTRTFSLTWESNSSTTYTLWESPDLSGGSWRVIDNAVPGEASTTSYELRLLPVEQTKRFYKVSSNP